jgi:DNA excision repair protein ERCC-2
LPKWILTEMNEGLLNLSTDMAISVSKQFLKTMAQPIEADTSGISLWSELDLHRHQTKDQLDMELDN